MIENWMNLKTQFSIKIRFPWFELGVCGGLFYGFGISCLIELSQEEFTLFVIRLAIPFVFFDVEVGRVW